MKAVPLIVVTLLSLIYAIYSKDPKKPIQFGEFKFYTSLSSEYIVASLFKMKHIIHYIVTYLLGIYAFGLKKKRRVLILCFALSFFIEFIQGFVPMRGGTLTDLIPNILGVLIGMLCVYVWEKTKQKIN